MVRTRVQLPNGIYKRAKRLANARETSMSDLVQRGLELILSEEPPPDKAQTEWQMPAPRHLGWKNLTDAEIKDLAQRTNGG